ncbi:GNAT family N-acetyltransferase [Alkalihalobacillus pseudalcaliphilus]|uniref:GNAT family N-acetyltransferase n=1 Tax=Alkalihalobacillus pseudalcaliphilus TaxID=79884 RepID=UPI00064D9972|nr:GNAT family N-acetyltransferase [Alkalihalobacillus pseudalcaliphilus]KMK77164.1 GNAT family acetyltransferase [Alkalihalobacillus pseudalcaliphilus]
MITITKEEKRHVVKNDHGEVVGEITFVPIGADKIIIDHTFVDNSMRGEGLAAKLVASVVERMKEEGKKIIPLCPFAKSEFEKNESYQEILASR